MELISVIIPMYNAEKTIEKCIKSIIHESAEIILVDDGSTDNTLNICEKYVKFYEKLKVISQKNMGPMVARYTGIHNATGSYVMFIDSDDFYEEGIIDRMLELIEKYNKPDLIRFRYKKSIDGSCQDKYFKEKEKYLKKEDFKELVYPMFLDGYMLNSLCFNCMKKDIFKTIKIENLEIVLGEDLLTSLEIFTKIKNAVFLEDVLYNYVYTSNSITRTIDKGKLLRNLEDIIEVYITIYKYLINWNMYSKENVEILSNRFKHVTKKIIEKIKDIDNE